jgi:hypothetical protein
MAGPYHWNKQTPGFPAERKPGVFAFRHPEYQRPGEPG